MVIMQEDLYNILEVNKDASKEDIKKSYKKLSKKHHPDISKEPDAQKKFAIISCAYAIISDQDKRKKYDKTGKVEQPSNIQERALEMLSNLFSDILVLNLKQDSNGSDNDILYIPTIEKTLTENLIKVLNLLKTTDEVISFFKNKRKKIIQKNKKSIDLYSLIIEKKIIEFQTQKDNISKDLKTIKTAKSLLKSYREKKTKKPELSHHDSFASFAQSNTTSTTTWQF